MLILLEGPDGAGKSTLAQSIAVEYNADIIHLGPDLDLDSPTLVQKYINILLSAQNQDIVIDRLWISEFIYGKIMRDGNIRINENELKILSFIFHQLQGILVLCLPPYEVCLQNYTKRKELEYVQDTTKFTRVYLEYFSASVRPTKYMPGRNTVFRNIKVYDYTRHKSWLTCMEEGML